MAGNRAEHDQQIWKKPERNSNHLTTMKTKAERQQDREQIKARKIKYHEERLTKLLKNRRDHHPSRIKAVVTTLRFYRAF
jgi:hypothetical protein